MYQMSIFDLLKPMEPQTVPKFEKGTRIYKLILDVVETGVIDHMWDLSDRWGYSAKIDSGCFTTFWTPNINDTVFTDAMEAYSKAERLKNTYKVIRTNAMQIAKERSFVRPTGDNRILLSATVKLLENNMVYYKGWMMYPFLKMFKTDGEAERFYKAELKKITEEVDGITTFETNIHVELNDMYLSRTGNWSNYDYTEFNIPVLTLPHHS